MNARTLTGLMKPVFILLILAAMLSCNREQKENQEIIVVRKSDIVRETLGVGGMSCVGCEVTVEKSISTINGVVHVKASHKDNQVVIEFDSTKTNLSVIEQQIREAGYKIISKEK